MPAYRPPGLFPPNVIAAGGGYVTADDDSPPTSSVLLVLHKPLDDAMVENIHDLVGSTSFKSDNRSRPITVVYIPTFKTEVTPDIILKFERAFHAKLGQTESIPQPP